MIPFFKSNLGEEEKKAICDVIDSGWVVQGAITKEFEDKFAEYVGAKYAVFVDSGTSALFLAVQWLMHKKKPGWSKGSFITVPSLTFTSTAEVLVNSGLKPVFVDVDKETFCADLIPSSPFLGVNLLGNRIKEWADIYDSAHRIGRDDLKNDKMPDSLWCYSFYATKNMTTINGGMIATNDEEAANWLKKARDHGISKGTTERYRDGDCLYSIDFVGWREKSDDVHASVGLEQLKKLDGFNKERERVVNRYNQALGLSRTGLHLFPILVDKRPEFIAFMRNAGIQVSIHFLPLHLMPAYKKYAKRVSLPNTEYIGERCVSLPLFPQLKDEEIDYIVSKVKESRLFIAA